MAQHHRVEDDLIQQPNDCKAFCLKYFCEGQRLEASLEEKMKAEKVEWTVKLAMLIPFLLVHVVWWTAFIRWDSWHKFTDKVGQMDKYKHLLRSDVKPWYMSVTMVFGSMPHVAKQFSYMIQSVGMTAAAFVILYMQVRVEWKSITYCSIGGMVGLIYGLEEIAPVLTPPYAKMSTSCWTRSTSPEIWKSADLTPYWWANLVLNWKALVLLAAGFIGGIFTSFAGSGIDICSFSVLTLLFRVSEKTATPTSVVLMAINTVIAMCYCKWMMREGLEALAWEFFTVCAPIVVIGAPLGSVVGSYVHRLVLATFVYVTDFVQLVGALIVVRPWSDHKCNKDGERVPHGSAGRWRGTNCEPVHLCWTSALLFASGLIAFYIFQLAGEKLMERNARIEKEVLGDGDPGDVEVAEKAADDESPVSAVVVAPGI
ncbi:sulfite exporter TauE/SafE [Aureococcus anophagefferens]|nr:sulfite exporter TauE/SafE [Aureococcus anophagefferens]